MSQRGTISVDVPEHATELQFETLAFTNRVPRTLRLLGPDGRVLGQVDVTSAMGPITIGPFPVRPGRATFTLTAAPGPAELSAADPRVASVFLNEPVFRPLLTN
jgi:hypothetical protein